MRRALLVLVVTVAVARCSDDDFLDRLASFHQHYALFFRAYFGCPKTAREITECESARGVFNRPEFDAAAKASRRLFGDR